MSVAAVSVQDLSHRYGSHLALRNIDFTVDGGEIFGLLGPNGGGKTTLFRILSTLLAVQEGTVAVFGYDARTQSAQIRQLIGVTFQSPSLDPKLTVRENLTHQARLYGLDSSRRRIRTEELLKQFDLFDRAKDRVESLSGGLKRRVEIAKGLLHHPRVLLLDEPSAGLDPAARVDLWTHLERLRSLDHVTVLVTTHLMEEAERCDSLLILDRGQVVGRGTPEELRASVGGDCVTLQAAHPDKLGHLISQRFGIQPRRVGELLRIERTAGHELLRDLMNEFPSEIGSASVGKPTLEDVFMARTGRQFGNGEAT